MKKLLSFSLLLIAMILFTGCTHEIHYVCDCKPELVPPAPMPPQSSGTATIALPSPVSPVNKLVILSDNVDMLRLRMTEGGNERAFAADLFTELTGSLGSTAARIVTDDYYDLLLRVTPSFSTVDIAGEFVRLDCSVNVQLTPRNGHQIYGSKLFEFKSGSRQLGMDNAKKQFTHMACEKISEWTRQNLARLSTQDINAGIVRFRVNPPVAGTTQPHLFSKEIVRIGEAISKLPGIVDYQLVEQDNDYGICAYRIVYFKDKIRNGLANQLAAALNIPGR
jgi:hypothetical protein